MWHRFRRAGERLGYLLASVNWQRKEKGLIYEAPGLTLQKSLFNLLSCAHMEEWGVLGGKQQPWRCLCNWGHLTVSLVGAFSSPYCLWAFPLSSFRSLLGHTVIKATPRISIQITFSSELGFCQMTYHPCFDLHHKLLEKRHSSHSLNLPDFQSTRITWSNICQETGWKSPSGEHPNRRICGGSLGLLHTLPYDGMTCQCKEVPTQPLPYNECQK